MALVTGIHERESDGGLAPPPCCAREPSALGDVMEALTPDAIAEPALDTWTASETYAHVDAGWE